MNDAMHPKEYVHQGSRMVDVPVLIHWEYRDQSGVTPYTAIATFDDGKFDLSESYWTDGNFGCDCNRGMASGLGENIKCGSEIIISKIESLDPLIPSLELNEMPG